MVSFLADTYALIEILKGNPRYKKYVKRIKFTTQLNLYELYVQSLKEGDKTMAQQNYFVFKSLVINIKDKYIFRAGAFKLEHSKKRLSYVDALGYAIAEIEGLRFLTGDREFERIKNVEYVK